MPELTFTESSILDRLDTVFKGIPTSDFPLLTGKEIKTNFFMDLEDPYNKVAGSRIHLYGDKHRWAIVFEHSAFNGRGSNAIAVINYVGNCIMYPVNKSGNQTYVSNTKYVELMGPLELKRVEHVYRDLEMESELIRADVDFIKVNGRSVRVEHDIKKYRAKGIEIERDEDNPDGLIGFSEFFRYLSDTDPEVLYADEKVIGYSLPHDLPKLMTIESFHFGSVHDKAMPPSKQELFKLIAKVLAESDKSYWKPTQKPNNHWSNWESGIL